MELFLHSLLLDPRGFFRETNDPGRNGIGLKQVNIYKTTNQTKNE